MAKAQSGGFSCGPIAARRDDKWRTKGSCAMEVVRAAQADVSKVDATKADVNHPRVGREVVSKAGGVASSPQVRWWTLCQ